MKGLDTSVIAAIRRTLYTPQSIFTSSRERREASHHEHLEVLYKVAGQTLGECPSWLLVAIERTAGRDVEGLDNDKDGKWPC